MATSFQGLVQFDTSYPNQSTCFLTTNEVRIKKAWACISPSDAGNRVHIGCSGWYNLDVIAHRKTPFLIWVDTDRSIRKLYEMTREVINECLDRKAFVKSCSERLQNFTCILSLRNTTIFQGKWDPESDACLQAELEKKSSWLASDESFNHVKSCFAKKQIVFLGADFTDSKKFEKIRKVLNALSLSVDTIYISNIMERLIGRSNAVQVTKPMELVESLNRVSDEKTSVIYASWMYHSPFQTTPKGQGIHRHKIVQQVILDKQKFALEDFNDSSVVNYIQNK